MQGSLVARVSVCAVVIAASIWALIPTFAGPEVQKTLEDSAQNAREVALGGEEKEFPWWTDWLPNRSVNLGLDLQGGIDLTLQVDIEEAILSSVARDIGSIKSAASQDQVTLGEVARERKQPRLRISAGPGTDDERVRSFMSLRFPSYAYFATDERDGVRWLLFDLTDSAQDAVADHAVQQARQTIENRINETGVKEPVVTIKGDSDISIQLPGETDQNDAIATVGTTARLEFLLVDEDADTSGLNRAVEEARAAMPAEEFAKDKALSDWMLDNGKLPAGRILRWQYVRAEGSRTEERAEPYVLKDEILLTGDDVNDAQSQSNGQTGEWYVALEFKPVGQAKFADITGENVGKRFAIMLDDKVKSAPVIREKINGTASIQMGAGNVDQQIKEAGQLSLWLRSGALPAPVVLGEVRTVGASLGNEAIEEGMFAAGLGSLLTLLFAAFYYRLSGVLADISLMINGLLVVACLAAFGATLTLPGICGIALTIGMALDCNIIIFERIREEMASGKSIRAAIEVGFDRAFVAVFDSNISTLLAGIVLFSYGTGPLKGFAVTLMIGIFTTLFTGVFVSRTLMELLASRRGSDQLSI